jgi:cytoplasmic FMR1 interacting protein
MYMYGSKNLTSTSSELLKVYGDYFGDAHFHTIVKLTGISGVLFVAQELQGHADMLLQNTLTTYINVIEKGTPQGLKLPKEEYGVEGAYMYFASHFKPLINYEDLQTEIFQTFREIGNIVVIVKGLQTAVNVSYQMGKIQTKSLFDDDELRFNLFASFFAGIRTTLTTLKEEWKTSGASEDLINDPKAFYKIWSALQFAFCGDKEEVIKRRENFGESLAWAGYI